MEFNCCNICCESFNRSNRVKINCCYCDYSACRICCEKYILSQSKPKCLNTECAKEWSRKFLRENFTNVFINSKYKTHLENLLFEKEISLMPATQPKVEEINRKRKIQKEITEINKIILDLNRKKSELERSLYIRSENKEKEVNFVRSCPNNGCKGFLRPDWKCGLCEHITCKSCHELIGPCNNEKLNTSKISGDDSDNSDNSEIFKNHICKQENIDSAKLLNKDSKPCPKCHALIFKIDGCNQIWCTQCHTAFDWVSGKLENVIHNPHFYEWQRKNGGLARANGDVECGRELDQYTLQEIYESIKNNHHGNLLKINIDYYDPEDDFENYIWDYRIYILESIIRQAIHNYRIEIRKYNIDYINHNEFLRIKYLLNEINENQFKKQIQINDKKNKKYTELRQIFELCNTILTDIIFRLIDNLNNSQPNKHNINKFMNEINELIKYCNELFSEVSYTYNCSRIRFNEYLQIQSLDSVKKLNKNNKIKLIDLTDENLQSEN